MVAYPKDDHLGYAGELPGSLDIRATQAHQRYLRELEDWESFEDFCLRIDIEADRKLAKIMLAIALLVASIVYCNENTPTEPVIEKLTAPKIATPDK